ncbi:class I SAM-dependent methyltransferase [Thalassospira povalilytica]|uniref:class I SAM-dependent methyltransferase n=1 Tax=Thalassospira povalilytica TaxID=732237 RepID=UPI001D196CD8|nr:class I SAM-dependent methyltransferase [Thalassospira povalilytica]MCC4241951.1 class I SAM-dependent methyltransferase [Thalassospira povalilytica]
MSSYDQKHFDSCAESYETEIGEEYPQWLKWNLLEKHIRKGARVADIGGANGRHARDVAGKLACDVVCVDLSEGMLRQLKARSMETGKTNGQVPAPVVARAQAIPLADGSMDAAWCYATLLLMPDQEVAISEIARIVKPGGTIILDIGNRWNLGWIYWQRFYKKRGFPGIFPLSRSAIRDLAVKLDCEIIENVPTGILSQLMYIPFVDKHTPLRRLIHKQGQYPDIDGRCSAMLPVFANRFYVVLKKRSG